MKLSNYVDPVRCFQLVSGVVGIYVSYLVTGIVHQSMLKYKYVNDYTQKQQTFNYASGFLIFPCGITWIIGELVNHFTIKPQDRVNIPAKNSAICGITVAISTLTYTYAIYLTNFPVVMMFKSCNILSVILVGVLCSRVKDKKLKLGLKKIVIGVLVTLGIVMFKVADPNLKDSQQKTQFWGIVLLIVSLLADGFLPDFQAQIKSDYKPQPMEMMTAINKWVTIISLAYCCIIETIFLKISIVDMFVFIAEHRKFLLHLLLMGGLSTLGQMFVYRMIKQFKQHFVPFVITTRKIFTVGLSIFFYNHPTNLWQILGLLMVFGIVTYEFVSELMGEKNDSHIHPHVRLPEKQQLKAQVSVAQIQPELQSTKHQGPTSLQSRDEIEQQSQRYQKRLAGQHGFDSRTRNGI